MALTFSLAHLVVHGGNLIRAIKKPQQTCLYTVWSPDRILVYTPLPYLLLGSIPAAGTDSGSGMCNGVHTACNTPLGSAIDAFGRSVARALRTKIRAACFG